MKVISIEDIARICHEANQAYCVAIGDASQRFWEAADEWQRESMRKGVRLILIDPTTTPQQSHEAWLAEKDRTGWVWGPVKDADKREHPCIVPYHELPETQRAKDYIFGAIVRSFLGGGWSIHGE